MSTSEGAVVVGIDGSPDAERGLDWAIAEAVDRTLPLHVVHALPPPVGDVPLAADEYRELASEAERHVAEARRRAVAAGVLRVDGGLVERSPMPALVAASRGAAEVVLGARGHGPLFGLLLGSVSAHVAGHAQCPVVVVREAADPAARRI
ncbi:MAG: universal stress protein, partial [Vicinamibacteria bacterium]